MRTGQRVQYKSSATAVYLHHEESAAFQYAGTLVELWKGVQGPYRLLR